MTKKMPKLSPERQRRRLEAQRFAMGVARDPDSESGSYGRRATISDTGR
jgi:hypothetical protein